MKNASLLFALRCERGQNFQRKRRVVSMRDPKRDQSVRVIVVRVALLLVPVCIYNNDILIIRVVW